MSEKRFGTFEGVFTPTLLSILGVIMYLRLGWVVGALGLQNALFVIVIANLISLFTCLSIASITTNIRIGTGGAYAIISKSLGLEVGGAIGIPLYLSQAISVAFYISGFTECWVSIFPKHDFLVVALATWGILFAISYISARLAFRLQFIVIAVIGFSVASFFMGNVRGEHLTFFHPGTGAVNFWYAFAIFFPAVTGILAGVSMSGELKEPERNIPIGILSAVAISFCIYAAMAFRYAYVASPQELTQNTSAILELGRWRSLIIAGIMGATISSALSMFVTGPRTLLALAKHRLIPFAASFKYVNKGSEPTTAILFTALISVSTLMLGNLDNIAALLTMFFLITYGTLNISVYLQKVLGIISYRPVFNIWLMFPFLGAIGCFFSMFLINPGFGAAAIVCIAGMYFMLVRREVKQVWPDVRKGLFIFIAEQSLKIASRLPYHPKIWKPNLVVAVNEPDYWISAAGFLKSMVSPSGRVDLLMVKEPSPENEEAVKHKDREIAMLCDTIKQDGVFAAYHTVEAQDRILAARTALQVLRTSPLAPNIILMRLEATEKDDAFVASLINMISSRDMGAMLFYYHPKLGLGRQKEINLWIREGSPNRDLAALIALNLERNWDGKIRLVQAAEDEKSRRGIEDYLQRFKKITRMPSDAQITVLVGKFDEMLKDAPHADLNIFGMSEELNFSNKRSIINSVNTSVLFLRDSKQESVTA